MSKHSQLFRRETARHLRSLADAVLNRYLGRRFSWLDEYLVPSRAELRYTLETLAEAIEQDDAAIYRQFADTYAEVLLASNTPPVAILAAADLLYATILQTLTPDQRDLVQDYLAVEQSRLQDFMYERVIRPAEQRGA